MYQGVIFDFDGVVVDTRQLQMTAFTRSCKAVYGEDYIPPCDEYFKLTGSGLYYICDRLKLTYDIIPHYIKICRDNINMISIKNNVINVIEELNEKGITCGLCTGKDRLRTCEILNYFNISHFFKTVVCSDDVNNSKPEPDSVLLSIQKMNVTKSTSIMVGDGINDIIAAKKSGIDSIAVSWGDISISELIDYKPTYAVYNAHEIIDIVCK